MVAASAPGKWFKSNSTLHEAFLSKLAMSQSALTPDIEALAEATKDFATICHAGAGGGGFVVVCSKGAISVADFHKRMDYLDGPGRVVDFAVDSIGLQITGG
jgi:hypothetical protein